MTRRCTLEQVTTNAALGLDYADTLTLLNGADTPANEKAWDRGHVRYKIHILERQEKSDDVRLLMFLGKRYLGQEADGEGAGAFDIKVNLDGESDATNNIATPA